MPAPATDRFTHTPTPAVLIPGFDDAVANAQTVFRATLQAMSHPGRIMMLETLSGVPQGLSPAMTAILLTLADGDTPLWLPAGVGAETARFLRFHTGCPLAEHTREAVFAAVPATQAAPDLERLNQGDPAYPDRSTTLILEVASLDDGAPLSLRGPGIRDSQMLRVIGLPADFVPQWQANNRRFPLGVDVLLTCGTRFCALPRTCHVEA